jgi:hypothetical protein
MRIALALAIIAILALGVIRVLPLIVLLLMLCNCTQKSIARTDRWSEIRRRAVRYGVFTGGLFFILLYALWSEKAKALSTPAPLTLFWPMLILFTCSSLALWHAIRVRKGVISRPDLLRVGTILREPNVAIRRAMIECYGLDRFVLEAKAKILDKWKDNELISIDLPQDPERHLVALKLRCPSTAAIYIIRVPPDQRTVQGSLAWSFGLDRPEDYVLQQES